MLQTGRHPRRAVSPLRQVMSSPLYWRWSVARQVTRLPTLMASLAFILVSMHATGKPVAGGLMITALILAQTFAAPFAARLMDRLGPAAGAELSLWLAAVALTGLAGAVVLKAPALVLVGLAGLAGVLMAGQGSATRSLLSSVVPPPLLPQALGVDATILEVLVVTAPLLAAGAAAISPPVALILMAACQGLGALLVRGLTKALPPASPAHTAAVGAQALRSNSLWRNRRLVYWMLMSVAFGHAIGTAETGVMPLSTQLGGGLGTGATLLAVEAGASALAGLTFAALSHKLPESPLAKAGVMLGLMIAGCIGMALTQNLVVVAASLLVLGCCIAPFDIVRSVTAEAAVPQERKTEVFSLLGATHALGFSLAGMLLAVLPLKGMLVAGGVSGMIVLALAPVFMARTSPEGSST